MSATLLQLIVQGDSEINRSIVLRNERTRLIADRMRLHDEFCAMRDASDVFVRQMGIWFWKHSQWRCYASLNGEAEETRPVQGSARSMWLIRAAKLRELAEWRPSRGR